MTDAISTTATLVDIMNVFLIMISAIFIFVIVSTLRDRRLRDIVRSAHFLNIESVVTAWTLIGSAFLLFVIVEALYSLKIVTDVRAYRLFIMIFGIFMAAGLFIQVRLLLRYAKQIREKRKKGKSRR